jgi:hypothetical protein
MNTICAGQYFKMQDLGSSVAMRMRRVFPYTASEACIPDGPAPAPAPAPRPRNVPMPDYAKACNGLNLNWGPYTTQISQNDLHFAPI